MVLCMRLTRAWKPRVSIGVCSICRDGAREWQLHWRRPHCPALIRPLSSTIVPSLLRPRAFISPSILPTVCVRNCVEAAWVSCSRQLISTMEHPSCAKNCADN